MTSTSEPQISGRKVLWRATSTCSLLPTMYAIKIAQDNVHATIAVSVEISKMVKGDYRRNSFSCRMGGTLTVAEAE